MQIRRLAPGDEELFRVIRLRALADAPWAFDSTLVVEREYEPGFWAQRLRESTGAVFAAVQAGEALAMAGGHLPDPARAIIWGVWTAPEVRGKGLSRRLVHEVMAWAGDQQVATIELSVSNTPPAEPAARLYEALGFTDTGRSEPLNSNLDLEARLLELNPARSEAGRPAWPAEDRG